MHPAALLLTSVLAASAQPQVQVEARRDGDAVTLQATAVVHASIEQAWHVLTDYERYPAFVPDLAVSRIVHRSGSSLVLDQEGEAGFIFFHYPVRVELEVTEQSPERVTAHAVRGNFRQMDGEYELRGEGGAVHLHYRGRLVPDFPLPPLVGLPALRNATQRQFAALVHEIDRQGAGQRGTR